MSKRGNAEGTIYQRKDGRWEAALSLAGGKRKRLYAKTRQEAAQKLTKALRDQQMGLPPTDDRTTVGAFLRRWLRDVVRSKSRPATYVSYERNVRLHIEPHIGRERLSKLSPQKVQTLLAVLQDEGLSGRSVSYNRAILRAALNQAIRWGLIHRNAAALAEAPRAKSREIRPLTPDEARCFLEAITGDRLEALYTTALALGLRQGEALALRWDHDVNLDAGLIRVNHALHRINGRLVLDELKTERSRRTLHLPAALVTTLRQHRQHQREERLMAGPLWKESGLVFTSTIGTPLDRHGVTRRFQDQLQAAGLPPHRFYDLRHSCASFLLAQGVPLRTIMEVLGHSTITLTANTYSHLSAAMLDDAAQRMNDFLTSRS